ncbi:MAG: sulfurtransferase [Anaerolineae bacterium]|nr:sulfurtransferase [Anaerolineae bacterium]
MSKWLVTTDWLAQHLQDTNLRIVDIRGKVLPATEPPPHYYSHRDDYLLSHIPGAVFVDWTTDIVEPGSPSYDIANPDRYAALMSELGIGDDTFVVAYDDAQGMFAARMWWTLRYYGHDSVAVLDGGWQKWLAENHPVTDQIPARRRATFTPRLNSALNATAADIRREQPMLLDVRSPQEFAGEASRATRKGRIPGSVNVPRKQMLREDGRLLEADQLRGKFQAAGLDLSNPGIVTYCNSGVSASFALLALEQIGIESASVYDGSWKDWANNLENPVNSE